MAVLALSVGFGIGIKEVCAGPASASLTVEHLTEAGLHLPSYMPTIEALMAYLERLPAHQELMVRWDARPGGRRDMVPKEEADKIALSPNFILLKRNTNLPGMVGKSMRPVTYDTIIVIAVDAAKQVRCITLQPESLEEFGEDLRPGQQQSWRYARPEVTMRIFLPDDPQIERLLFFNPVQINPDPDRSWKLQERGSLVLPPPKDPGER